MNISQAQPAPLTNCGITLSGNLPTPAPIGKEDQSCETGEEGYGPVEKREEQGGDGRSLSRPFGANHFGIRR